MYPLRTHHVSQEAAEEQKRKQQAAEEQQQKEKERLKIRQLRFEAAKRRQEATRRREEAATDVLQQVFKAAVRREEANSRRADMTLMTKRRREEADAPEPDDPAKQPRMMPKTIMLSCTTRKTPSKPEMTLALCFRKVKEMKTKADCELAYPS